MGDGAKVLVWLKPPSCLHTHCNEYYLGSVLLGSRGSGQADLYRRQLITTDLQLITDVLGAA